MRYVICDYDEYKDAMCDYDESKNEAYQRGLNDAWEAARKIALPPKEGLTYDELVEIFHVDHYYKAIEKYTAAEVIEKIKTYEEQKNAEYADEINIGDEVYCKERDGKPFVITSIFDSNCDLRAAGYTKEGRHTCWDIKDLVKTGRHFPQIAEVLKAMEED